MVILSVYDRRQIVVEKVFVVFRSERAGREDYLKARRDRWKVDVVLYEYCDEGERKGHCDA